MHLRGTLQRVNDPKSTRAGSIPTPPKANANASPIGELRLFVFALTQRETVSAEEKNIARVLPLAPARDDEPGGARGALRGALVRGTHHLAQPLDPEGAVPSGAGAGGRCAFASAVASSPSSPEALQPGARAGARGRTRESDDVRWPPRRSPRGVGFLHPATATKCGERVGRRRGGASSDGDAPGPTPPAAATVAPRAERVLILEAAVYGVEHSPRRRDRRRRRRRRPRRRRLFPRRRAVLSARRRLRRGAGRSAASAPAVLRRPSPRWSIEFPQVSLRARTRRSPRQHPRTRPGSPRRVPASPSPPPPPNPRGVARVRHRSRNSRYRFGPARPAAAAAGSSFPTRDTSSATHRRTNVSAAKPRRAAASEAARRATPVSQTPGVWPPSTPTSRAAALGALEEPSSAFASGASVRAIARWPLRRSRRRRRRRSAVQTRSWPSSRTSARDRPPPP